MKPLILNNYTVQDFRVQLENWTWDSFDCNNVKTLCIRLFNFSKQLLQEFNSKFPLLETLDLNFYDDELKISGNGLKSLRLLYCGAKPMLQVNCENLHSFKRYWHAIPSSFTITPCCLLRIENTLYLHNHLDTLSFLTLRQYLGNFKEHQTLKLFLLSTTVSR